MPLSMYQASVPLFVHGLKNLAAILKKADDYAQAKKIDPSVLLQSRLYPDMFPLTRQVQIACDVVKGAAARLAGVEVPSFPDTESSFAELQTRIEKTIAFVSSQTAAGIDGSEARDISLTIGGKPARFKGQDYLLLFVLPNLHFHTAVAYAILRHNGLEVGKMDFLGALPVL